MHEAWLLLLGFRSWAQHGSNSHAGSTQSTRYQTHRDTVPIKEHDRKTDSGYTLIRKSQFNVDHAMQYNTIQYNNTLLILKRKFSCLTLRSS